MGFVDFVKSRTLQKKNQDLLKQSLRLRFGSGVQNKSGYVAVKLEAALPCAKYKTEKPN